MTMDTYIIDGRLSINEAADQALNEATIEGDIICSFRGRGYPVGPRTRREDLVWRMTASAGTPDTDVLDDQIDGLRTQILELRAQLKPLEHQLKQLVGRRRTLHEGEPEPWRRPPENGTPYYIPWLVDPGACDRADWAGHVWDLDYLTAGLACPDARTAGDRGRFLRDSIDLLRPGLPEPLTEPLEVGAIYYVPDLKRPSAPVEFQWTGYPEDLERLEAGLIHALRDNAEIWGQAFREFSADVPRMRPPMFDEPEEWTPYFVPDLTDPFGPAECIWENDAMDHYFLESGAAFASWEDAVTCARTLIAMIGQLREYLPEPLAHPEERTELYLPNVTDPEIPSVVRWTDTAWQRVQLTDGLLHGDRDNAVIWGTSMASLLQAEYEQRIEDDE